VDFDALGLVIVEPSPTQPLVIELEAERFNEMQGAARIGCETNNVTGVWRYFGLK
jgi:hypothetical protein